MANETTEKGQSQERKLIDCMAPEFQGKDIGELYSILITEFYSVRGATQFALEVPDDVEARRAMAVRLVQMFAKRMDKGENSDATLVQACSDAMWAILPAPESPEFAKALSRRVNIGAKLIDGGVIEAMGALVRHRGELGNEATISAAKKLGKPSGKSSIPVHYLSPANWSSTVGTRVIEIDAETQNSKNNKLLAQIVAKFKEIAPVEINTILDLFNERVINFTPTRVAQGRTEHVAPLTIEWRRVLFVNLLGLNVENEERVKSVLNIAIASLRGASDSQTFTRAVSNIGKQ